MRPAVPADPHFLPVTILPDPSHSTSTPPSHLELVLTNGRRIAVAPAFDADILRRLPADMRKRFDGVVALASGFDLDPFSGHLLDFLNKRRYRIKILY